MKDSITVDQLCELIVDALSLNHGKGCGRSYYAQGSGCTLFQTLKRLIEEVPARPALQALSKNSSHQIGRVFEVKSSRTVDQLCQLIMDALSLNHGKGYGRSHYAERSRSILFQTLKRLIEEFLARPGGNLR